MPEHRPDLHPSNDPRASIVAFARLVARLCDPFCDRPRELGLAELDEQHYSAVEKKWVDRARLDPGAMALFEQAYAQEIKALQPTLGSDEPTEDARFLGARQDFRTEAALVEASASSEDANETLPIVAPAGPALPFGRGEFQPLPSLRRSKEVRRPEDDPDATRLPTKPSEDTLPFGKAPRDPNDPSKRR